MVSLIEGHGVPIGVVTLGAHRHDMKLVRPTIESLVVERPEPTEAQPQGMCMDKGYDYDEVRDILYEFGFTAHIRARGEEAKVLKTQAKKVSLIFSHESIRSNTARRTETTNAETISAVITRITAFNDRDVNSIQYQITALGTAMDAAYYTNGWCELFGHI